MYMCVFEVYMQYPSHNVYPASRKQNQNVIVQVHASVCTVVILKLLHSMSGTGGKLVVVKHVSSDGGQPQ